MTTCLQLLSSLTKAGLDFQWCNLKPQVNSCQFHQSHQCPGSNLTPNCTSMSKSYLFSLSWSNNFTCIKASLVSVYVNIDAVISRQFYLLLTQRSYEHIQKILFCPDIFISTSHGKELCHCKGNKSYQSIPSSNSPLGSDWKFEFEVIQACFNSFITSVYVCVPCRIMWISIWQWKYWTSSLISNNHSTIQLAIECNSRNGKVYE